MTDSFEIANAIYTPSYISMESALNSHARICLQRSRESIQISNWKPVKKPFERFCRGNFVQHGAALDTIRTIYAKNNHRDEMNE